MPKGQKHDEQDIRDAVATFENLGGDTAAARTVAADFGVNYKTVLKWANGQKKAKPKRKTARKATKQAVSYDKMFKAYIYHKNEAAKYQKQLKEALQKALK